MTRALFPGCLQAALIPTLLCRVRGKFNGTMRFIHDPLGVCGHTLLDS